MQDMIFIEDPQPGELVMLVGIPGSGKSTFIKNHPSWKPHTISTDELRLRLTGDMTDQSQNPLVFATIRDWTSKRLRLGLPVVVDSTAADYEARVEFLRYQRSVVGETLQRRAVWFRTPLEEALERNANRDRKCPVAIIEKMHQQLQDHPIEYADGFDIIQDVHLWNS